MGAYRRRDPESRDKALLLDLLLEWPPEDATRRRILVDAGVVRVLKGSGTARRGPRLDARAHQVPNQTFCRRSSRNSDVGSSPVTST